MDEEQEILQSSITQGDKISIDSFFGSPIGGLANRAIMQSNSSLKSSMTNRGLIASLQASIELLKTQVRQITNYVLIDRQERNKLIKQRETQDFQREDDIQKGIVSPENAQPTGLEDSLPFFPENRFSQGLTAGMSSIGEPKGVAKFQQEVGQEVEGSTPFFFGGLVPGRGNADTVNAKLTPGEFVVPKNTVENFSPNFFEGLTASKPQTNSSGNIVVIGGKEIDLSKVGPKTKKYYEKILMRENLSKNLKEEGIDVEFTQGEDGTISGASQTGGEPGQIVSSTGETNKENKGFFSKLFGGKKNENVKKNDYFVNPEDATNMSDAPRYVKDAVGNFDVAPTTEQLTKGFSTYDDDFTKSEKKENKGIFGGLFGGGKKETQSGFSKENYDMGRLSRKDFKNDEDFEFYKNQFGDVFDVDSVDSVDSVKSDDKRGLFGMIGGSVDAATGGLTDLDRRGGKPFGLMRGITGSIDTMTGGLTDLDRRGGKPFGTMRLATGMADAMTGNMFDLDRRGDGKQKQLRPSEDPSHPMYQKIQKLKNQKDQIPMKTTVNPDGSISSEGSGTLIGGELVEPGKPLTEKQKAAKAMGILMGNTEDSVKAAPSESIKETSQNVMSPPPPPESETIELPPQIQGDSGGDNSIPQAAPSFQPSTPKSDPLTGTESPLIFVEVISNPFLSIP